MMAAPPAMVPQPIMAVESLADALAKLKGKVVMLESFFHPCKSCCISLSRAHRHWHLPCCKMISVVQPYPRAMLQQNKMQPDQSNHSACHCIRPSGTICFPSPVCSGCV